MKRIIYVLLGILPVICSCQEKKQKMIRFVIQPEVEINKQQDFWIYFSSKPDNGTLRIDDIDGLEITSVTGLDESQIMKMGSSYAIYAYVTPTRTGKIDIPPVSMKVDGTEYKSDPFSFHVVDNITIGPDAVRTFLVSDKSTYNLQDTIKLSLYQYSRFYNVNRYAPESKGTGDISVSGDGNEIKAGITLRLYDITGIRDLKEYLSRNFKVVHVDWNEYNRDPAMGVSDHKDYIITEVFSISLMAKSQGEYLFQPSIFEYLVYKSNDDYFGKFVPNENGAYSVTDNGATKLMVKSDSVKIRVK